MAVLSLTVHGKGILLLTERFNPSTVLNEVFNFAKTSNTH